MSLELILARIADVEDYVDSELDELEEAARVLAFIDTIEARQRREGDDELSRRLDALEQRIAGVTITNVFASTATYDTPEDALRAAIATEDVVEFKYRDAEGVSSYRVVSPYALQDKQPPNCRFAPFLSLVGYDHGREGMRHFRVERIEGAVGFTDAEDYREPQEV